VLLEEDFVLVSLTCKEGKQRLLFTSDIFNALCTLGPTANQRTARPTGATPSKRAATRFTPRATAAARDEYACRAKLALAMGGD